MNRKRLVKVIGGLLLILLLFGAVQATAEGFDLAQMTNDEIAGLLNQVTGEFVKRGIEKTATLAKGAYIAGEDLPAGRYVYTCLAKGNDWGNVTIYSDRGEGKQLMWNVVTAPEEGEEPDTIYITLNEGDQLKSGVAFSLTIMAAVAFR